MTTELRTSETQCAANTDRELWREREGDYYADSIHVTAQGGIGIKCGGYVYVKPLREWFKLAGGPFPAMPEPAEHIPSNHQLLRALREIAKCLELAAAGQSIQLAAARGKVADVIDWQSGERPGCGCSECRSQRAAPETFVGRYDAKLDELANLPHGWDSYDGIPPRGDCLAKARQLAALLPEGHWDIVPMSNGGLQIEQHCGGLDIELMIEGARPELKANGGRNG